MTTLTPRTTPPPIPTPKNKLALARAALEAAAVAAYLDYQNGKMTWREWATIAAAYNAVANAHASLDLLLIGKGELLVQGSRYDFSNISPLPAQHKSLTNCVPDAS